MKIFLTKLINGEILSEDEANELLLKITNGEANDDNKYDASKCKRK